MADVGPKAELKALGNDFATAKPDDTRLRHPLIEASEHLSDSLDALAHDHPRAGGPVKRSSALFTKLERGRTQNRTSLLPVALRARQLIDGNIMP
jgi:hypothetical protein